MLKEFRVRITFSLSNYGMTNSIIETPEVGVQLPVVGNTVRLRMTVWTNGYIQYMPPSHLT